MLRLWLEIGIGIVLLSVIVILAIQLKDANYWQTRYKKWYYNTNKPLKNSLEKVVKKYKYFSYSIYDDAKYKHLACFQITLDKNNKTLLKYYYNDYGQYKITSSVKPNYDNEKLLEFIKELNSIYL